MEDYHAEGSATGSGERRWPILARALGAAALLACVVLRVGGVEIARADSPVVEADGFIRLNGEPIGTAVPAQIAGCEAGPAVDPAAIRSSLQKLVDRGARQGIQRVEGRGRDGDLPVALNGSGYNYGPSLERSGRRR